jgi:CheY-like chemotaxis protein/HPt (histidine-containing phosphotransfer) domain-containing protein
MFTSDSRPGDFRRRQEAGLSGYAVKPVKRTELLRLLSAAMPTGEVPELPSPQIVDRSEKLPCKHMRILIAEDSVDNRLLIEAYLKGSSHVLTFVNNGKAALDSVAAGSFDLILMDMQMPVMDGLTSTRRIRALEQERGSAAIPIVGLSANARQQDIELSGNAGCNQHLSKPISRHKLLSTIAEYASMRAAADAPGTESPAESAQTIRIEAPPGLEEIVPGYLAARRKELPEMRELLGASGFARLAVLAHDIKGTGGSYGFSELTRMGAALEHSAKQMDGAALTVVLDELTDYLGRVRTE